jgi:hypothetical protein
MQFEVFRFRVNVQFTKKVFLSQGDAIFVAREGQIINRRYRIEKIGLSSVEVEDLIEHSLHTLPLPG